MNIEVLQADYGDPHHARDIVLLLNAYALDPMGGSKPLTADVQQHLVEKLAALPHAVSVLCYVDGQAAGLVNCFEGFSTFSCKKLLNIHDVAVLADYRGLGVGQRMLGAVEQIARARDCCKLTLEVLEGNAVARGSYEKFGFAAYQLDPAMGWAMFWEKPLSVAD